VVLDLDLIVDVVLVPDRGIWKVLVLAVVLVLDLEIWLVQVLVLDREIWLVQVLALAVVRGHFVMWFFFVERGGGSFLRRIVELF
jgi:hypothetical protein